MQCISRNWLLSGGLALCAVTAAGPAAAQLSLEQKLSPEQVAQEAGTVKGTATACQIDSRTFEERANALLEQLSLSGMSSSKLTEIYDAAARQGEHQQRSEPQVACDDFRGMFDELLINNADWTPAKGWEGL